MNKQRKNEKGFTMIELIIVVAIMGILAAILVPSFAMMSRKSRLTSDIRTLQTVQKQIDLYYGETGIYPTSTGSFNHGQEVGAVMAKSVIAEGLVEQKYFDPTNSFLELQTRGASAVWDSNKAHVVIDLTNVKDPRIEDIANNIISASGEDADWISQ